MATAPDSKPGERRSLVGSTPTLSATCDVSSVANWKIAGVGEPDLVVTQMRPRLAGSNPASLRRKPWGCSSMEEHPFCTRTVEGSTPSFSTLAPEASTADALVL